MDEQEEGLLDEEATFVVGGVEVNPAEHGYTAVHNYASYFWRPYLGNTAFALWELLLSFCYGDNNTAFPSIARLARMLTNSDHSRAVVTGRRRPQGLTPLGFRKPQRSCDQMVHWTYCAASGWCRCSVKATDR